MKCTLDDRELDAWIFEKIMGWVKQPTGDNGVEWYKDPSGSEGWNSHDLDDVPQYTQDLNACREAEMKLDGVDFFSYLHKLGYYKDGDMGKVVLATARQRCEAMYLTMLNE